jgi:hypothetical protein
MSKMMERNMSVMQGPSASRLQGWTLALAAAGVVSLGSVVQAEEAQNHVMTALSSTTLSGYIDTSASWRVGKNSGPIWGRTFDGADKQDGFNLNVVKLTLEKPLDEGEWSAGYKADLVFGPDANYYQTLLNGGGGPDIDDFAVKQAYAAFRVPVGNGLDVKLGVFDTLVGYEVFESGNNPNSSRSYGYAIEPTHHTGVLASYHVSDMISLSAGVANTYFSPINARSPMGPVVAKQTQKAYMGSVTITLPENLGVLAGSSIYAGVVDGLGGNSQDTTSYYIGQTLNTPLEGLSVGAAFDYRTDGVNGTNPGDNWAWALAGYVSYQASEKLKLNARGDWTKGQDGTYFDAAGGDKVNKLLSATLTADYSLWSGLITRLEGRWDHDLSGNEIYGDNNVFTVALNAIYKF